MVPVADPWQREWGAAALPMARHRAPRCPSLGARAGTPDLGDPQVDRIGQRPGAYPRAHLPWRGTRGDGVSARIAVDGRVIFSADLGGASTAYKDIGYDVEADLRAGSKVDFIVTPGPDADIDFDSTKFEARIVQDPP